MALGLIRLALSSAFGRRHSIAVEENAAANTVICLSEESIRGIAQNAGVGLGDGTGT